METDTNAALAGDSESSNFLSDDAAASMIEGLLGPEDDEDQGGAPPDQSAQQDDEPAETAEDESATPAEEAEPATESSDDKVAHGNMKTRLRDGTELTVGELKKLADEARDLRAAQAKWQADQATIQAHAQRMAQQEAFFQNAIQNAIAIQQAHMPPEPDQSLRDSDPIEYFTQKDRYEQARAKLGNLINQQQAGMAERQRQMQLQAQQSQAAQAEQMKSFLAEQQTKLLEKMPELREPAKAREFHDKFISGVAEYGFSPEEASKAYDYRLVLMAKDAMAYRALQKAKPAVQAKTANAAPVQQPGRRVTPNEQQARAVDTKMAQLRKSGSMDDAASILIDFL